MMIRQGFVSNSSTSSSVVLGYQVKAEECHEFDKEMVIRVSHFHCYLGKIIASCDMDGINEQEFIDWKDIKAITEEGAKHGLGKPNLYKFSIDS